jgi:hypothetical protein
LTNFFETESILLQDRWTFLPLQQNTYASLELKITHYYSVVADLIPSREFSLVNVPAGPFL